MCENVKISCSCDEGYDKGVLKKTIENNVFTIFGNLSWNNWIVIRYHGILTENTHESSFSLIYCFDLKDNKKEEISLTKCTKCEGDCYCAVLNLEKYSKIYFGFKDENGNIDQNSDKLFELEIKKDPISNIMQRYGFEDNTSLPLVKDSNHQKLNHFKNIIEKIKCFFSKYLKQNQCNN